MKLRKGIALVLSFILLFSISFPNISNAESNQNTEITIEETNGNDIQIKTEQDGVEAVLNFDKETNEIILITNEQPLNFEENMQPQSLEVNEQSQSLEENEKVYKVDVETATSEKIVATFTDSETGEEYFVNTDQLQASIAFLVPIGVIIGEALLAHLVSAGLAIIIGGVTYAAATEVIKDLQKKKEYDHYVAKLDNNALFIGNNISLSTAASHLISGGDVWSRTGDLAAKVAREAGGGKPPVPSENHMNTGSKKNLYYHHYHANGRKGGHSFYGVGVKGLK